jgi:hypothetical protein
MKYLYLSTALVLSLGLAGCMGAATTGTTSSGATAASSADSARAANTPPPVVQMADKDMGCEQIETEMAQLEQFEGVSRNAEMASTATKVGQAATTQAAVMGLGGSVPYIGGIGNIFGSVMGARADNAQKEAEQAQDRMNRLMGIYSVKCQ